MPREELWKQDSCGTDLSFFFPDMGAVLVLYGSNMENNT